VEDPLFVVRPAPLGKRNQIPASDRGWIYFERLVSTIRVALTDEQYAARTVYANIPELKESILQRAHILRQAAASSNSQLKAQFQSYIEEIRTKTFQATSLDKKKASAQAKVSDTDLVFSLLSQLRARISLALALTVRNLSVDECRELLEEKADLTIQDGRGYTVLHNATRWRNPEVAQFLLDNGSSQGLRDKLGNTAGHVIPLYADDITVDLCRILGDDEKYLAKMNRAGLPVLKRIETWALTAVDGKPFQKALDWVKDKQEQFPRLLEGGKKTCVKMCAERFEVECSSMTLMVNSKPRRVHVVEPKFPEVVHIVYLGFPRFVPFSLQLPALKQWAGQGAKVWAISEDAVDPETMTAEAGKSPDEFLEDLADVIKELLPSLPEKFILVDSSWGPGTAMAWQFKEHLLGAMIINVHLFKPPDFDATEAAKKIKNRMQQLGGMFERRDMENIQSFLTDIMFPSGGADGVAETKRRFVEALEEASENFWRLSALQPSWNFENLTKIFTTLEEWPLESPPVVLACSDQAPLVVVSESMQRLNQIMAGSKLEFISSSKWSWPLEGQDVLDEITCLLRPLVPLPELQCQVINVFACEDQRPIHVIGPDGPAVANILYLGLPRFIPFELQLPALKMWAQRLRVKIWCIMEDSISSSCLEGNPKDLQDELISLTNTLLPELGEGFLLVDSTFGSGVPLAWHYRSKLSGALILNCHLFMAPDFATTEAGGRIRKRMATLGEMFAKRDEEKILSTLPDFMYPSGGAEGVEETKKRYKEAVNRASENFWKISALQPSWNFEHITEIISSLDEWPRDSLPVILACSDQAPGVVVTESMQRLNHLMAGSELKFISSSKWSWQLEGNDIISDVMSFLDGLLPTKISKEKENKKPLPLLGKQVILPPILEGGTCNPCRNVCGEVPVLCPMQ